MTNRADRLTRLNQLLAAYIAARPEALRRVNDWADAPTIHGQHDATGSQPWCDTHERTVDRCHHHGHPCLGVPLPDRSDPVGDTAVTRVIAGNGDTVTAPEQHYRTRLASAEAAVIDAISVLTSLWSDIAHLEHLPQPAGSGPCDACDAHMPGVGNHRLRTGLCLRCYRAWDRHRIDHPDTSLNVWRTKRRARLARGETLDDIDNEGVTA